jgi:hypothetical protein
MNYPLISFACNHSAPGPFKENRELEEQPKIHREHHQRAIRGECKCNAPLDFDERAISGLTKEKYASVYLCDTIMC